MASISSLGVGAGIDLGSILSQLMEAQRQPLYELQSKGKKVTAQISDYGSLKSAVSSFKDSLDKLTKSTAFNAYQTTSSNDSVFTATADDTAAIGNYGISVTQLAKAHKVASMRYADSTSATVGTGSLSITVGGNTMNLTVDSSNNTLAGLRNSINTSSDNPGVTATIVNEGGGSRLMLTSNETGLANAMTITPTGLDAGLFDTTNDQDGNEGNNVPGQAELISAAQDAVFSMDSFSLSSPTNSVTDVIEGVTLNLKTPGNSNLSISRDDEQLSKLVQGVVDAYNTLRNKISSLREGNLGNDSTLRQIESMLVSEMTRPAGLGGLKNLFEAGITRDRYGKLSFDSSVFKDAMASDASQVIALFSDANEGFAVRLSNLAKSMTDSNGLFEVREEGLNSRLKSLRESEDRMKMHLTDMEARLKKQFSNLDSTMARLNSTSAYLSSQLASLM